MIFADILRTRAGIVSRPVDFDTLKITQLGYNFLFTDCAKLKQRIYIWIVTSVTISIIQMGDIVISVTISIVFIQTLGINFRS